MGWWPIWGIVEYYSAFYCRMHWSLYEACKQAVKVSMKTTEIQELIDFITKSGLEKV